MKQIDWKPLTIISLKIKGVPNRFKGTQLT